MGAPAYYALRQGLFICARQGSSFDLTSQKMDEANELILGRIRGLINKLKKKSPSDRFDNLRFRVKFRAVDRHEE
jgi:hypothetical protein